MSASAKQKTALLVGSSYSAAPMFFALKRRGLHVTVCGNSKDDPCHQYADASCYIDYSDKAALLEVVSKGSFDFLVPSCNDFAYVSCSWVAQNIAFAGYDAWDTALMLHTKNRFREFCEKHALPAPKRQLYNASERANDDLDYPVLVKPVDSFSGRGTTKVPNQAQLPSALTAAKKASRTGEAVIEQFIEGGLHSHSAFIQNGQIFWDEFVDEYCTVYPYQVNCSNCPSNLPEAIRQQVRAAMSRVISHAALNDGLLHTQFIVFANDFWIIESMRRCPGDLYGRLIEAATGIEYTDMYVAKFLGETYSQKIPSQEKKRFVGRHTVSVSEPTVSSDVALKIPSRKASFVPLKISGERLGVAPFDKLGILFVEFDSASAMLAVVPKFVDAVELASLEKTYG
jgi:formate-dependent phosphoribosylglycinamide formyltransferase (GAR transformylase)